MYNIGGELILGMCVTSHLCVGLTSSQHVSCTHDGMST